MMSPDARRLWPATLKLRMTSVVIVLVLAATVLVTLLALAIAERGMKGMIGDQQFEVISSAAAFIDDRLDAKKQLMNALAANADNALYRAKRNGRDGVAMYGR